MGRHSVTSSFNSGAATPSDFSLDPFAGLTTWRGKPIADAAGVIDHLTTGGMIKTGSKGVITYTFYDGRQTIGLYNNPVVSFGALDGLAPFTSAQKAAARDAVQLWDDLIPQTFVESTRRNADIMFANSADPAQAYAYTPPAQHVGHKYISDLFVSDPETNLTNTWFDFGGYGNTTLVHELGHTLGMTHPGDYNFSRDADGDGVPDPITYVDDADYAQDSDQYTIMSYFSGTETGARAIDWNLIIIGYAQGPMVHDILAIQAIYGADKTTRTGDTTYGFNSNAGNDLFDFNLNPYPYYAVYDAGGIDTIDASGFTVSQFIDLHDGAFSSIGGAAPAAAEINANLEYYYSLFGLDYPDDQYWTDAEVAGLQATIQSQHAARISADMAFLGLPAVTGIGTTSYQNFAIAYGTVIENATGGSARDLLHGNEVANSLKGMGGNDVLNGFEGADKLYGGDGNDTFQFSNLERVDQIMDWNAGDKIDLTVLDAVAGTSGNQAFAFVGSAAFTNTAGELRYADGVLQGDVNGDGVADWSVTIVGSPTISSTDILL